MKILNELLTIIIIKILLPENRISSEESKFFTIASIAWDAAILVSHDVLVINGFILVSSCSSSFGWFLTMSPIWWAAERRKNAVWPVSNRINSRSSL